jgi:hypothetical protein
MTRAPGRGTPLRASGQVCAMMATDIADFSSPLRDDEIRLHLRKALYEMLTDALTGSGIPWQACHHEDRGDGVLVIIPPGIPAGGLIDPFASRLRILIRRHNRMSCEQARMQLRAAVHVGPVYSDAHGVAGADIITLFRLLDARPLRKALEDTSAELALAVSGYVHDNMVLRHPSLADPAQFTPLKDRVKRTTIRGWLYVPGTEK